MISTRSFCFARLIGKRIYLLAAAICILAAFVVHAAYEGSSNAEQVSAAVAEADDGSDNADQIRYEPLVLVTGGIQHFGSRPSMFEATSVPTGDYEYSLTDASPLTQEFLAELSRLIEASNAGELIAKDVIDGLYSSYGDFGVQARQRWRPGNSAAFRTLEYRQGVFDELLLQKNDMVVRQLIVVQLDRWKDRQWKETGRAAHLKSLQGIPACDSGAVRRAVRDIVGEHGGAKILSFEEIFEINRRCLRRNTNGLCGYESSDIMRSGRRVCCAGLITSRGEVMAQYFIRLTKGGAPYVEVREDVTCELYDRPGKP